MRDNQDSGDNNDQSIVKMSDETAEKLWITKEPGYAYHEFTTADGNLGVIWKTTNDKLGVRTRDENGWLVLGRGEHCVPREHVPSAWLLKKNGTPRSLKVDRAPATMSVDTDRSFNHQLPSCDPMNLNDKAPAGDYSCLLDCPAPSRPEDSATFGNRAPQPND